MYKRIEAQIILSGVSRKELAQALGMSYNTLNLKLSGKRDFSLDEAIKVKRLLNAKEPVEMLFESAWRSVIKLLKSA